MGQLATWLKESPARSALILFESNGQSGAGFYVVLTENKGAYDEVSHGFAPQIDHAAELALQATRPAELCEKAQ